MVDKASTLAEIVRDGECDWVTINLTVHELCYKGIPVDGVQPDEEVI